MNVTIRANANSLTDETLIFDIDVQDRHYSRNELHHYTKSTFISTVTQISILNSFEREKMMRVLEFTEIIEEAVGDHPAEIIENGTHDLQDTFTYDGYNIKLEWEYPRK